MYIGERFSDNENSRAETGGSIFHLPSSIGCYAVTKLGEKDRVTGHRADSILRSFLATTSSRDYVA